MNANHLGAGEIDRVHHRLSYLLSQALKKNLVVEQVHADASLKVSVFSQGSGFVDRHQRSGLPVDDGHQVSDRSAHAKAEKLFYVETLVHSEISFR